MKKMISIMIFTLIIVAVCFITKPTYVKKDEDAAQIVAESFIKKHMSIEEYEVIYANFNTDHYVHFCYDIKPKENNFDDWYEGNEQSVENGWIVEKSGFVRYFNIGRLYFTGIIANTGI